jgi:hypothetical protein
MMSKKANKYIVNPVTGRLIQNGGSTHKQLLKGKTPCQISYQKCQKDVESGVQDLFCKECDKDGYYINTKWSHPLSRLTFCLDRYTGKEIPGTQRNRGDKYIDCDTYQS